MKQILLLKGRTGPTIVIFLLVFLLPIGRTSAQGLIATMAEQLAKLELYLQEVKQGYTIVQKGLNTIGEIKKGDFDLHSLFFNSLSEVNPAIKNWGKVADIVSMEVQILSGCATTLKQFSTAGTFSAADVKYLTAVYSNLKDLTLTDVEELTGLITDGNWQMSDDERMSRIDQLFNRVSEKYGFLRSFSNRVYGESQYRAQGKTSLQNLSKLFQP